MLLSYTSTFIYKVTQLIFLSPPLPPLHCDNRNPVNKKRGSSRRNMSAAARLKKELTDLVKGEAESGVVATPINDNIMHLTGSLKGPDGTPYDGGTFIVDIIIPQQYPFEPPKMKFTTKVWHPNISSQTGAICLDILKDKWSPALTIKTALLSLQALLSAPEPDDPQDAQVAGMYKQNRAKFNETASQWTAMYAQADSTSPEIEQIVAMGFSKAAARDALASSGGDVSAAINALLG